MAAGCPADCAGGILSGGKSIPRANEKGRTADSCPVERVEKVDNALQEGASPSCKITPTTRVATRVVEGRSSCFASRDAHVLGSSIEKDRNF